MAASKLDLEDDNVDFYEVTVTAVRDEEIPVFTWLDEAQARVFTGELTEVYVVIRIAKDE
jgi:hypothetical protein